ncbi:hypothetical protein MLD38_034014 [Melastoma candidum]|uniref:Uncharacterized protein n=1 Tax=Melastoma candidum TaxID=119954 RepID=A0ACB9M8Q6_9MYRT|nr:hypothetical protein MLD38_034014 [Melastoma candidum]
MWDSASAQSPPPGLLDLPQSDDPGPRSGASTPPLWPTSPPDIPTSADIYCSLSPASRTQAILRGQRELMEFVRNLPETSYELSLKDFVDLPPPRDLLDEDKRPSIEGDRVTEGHGRRRRRRGFGYGDMGKEQRQQQEEQMLKMVFPVYTGAAAARGRNGLENRRQGRERSEEEWWRKKDGDSESGNSSYSSTIWGSRKGSGRGSSSGSSRSNSNSSSVIAVRL